MMNGNIMNRSIPNGDIKKIRRIMLITTGAILGVIVVGLSISNTLTQRRPIFVTVDTAILVSKQAEQLAARYPKGKIETRELQQIAEQLKESVMRIATENNLVVLAKGAVWGGDLPDYTNVILDFITNQQTKPLER